MAKSIQFRDAQERHAEVQCLKGAVQIVSIHPGTGEPSWAIMSPENIRDVVVPALLKWLGMTGDGPTDDPNVNAVIEMHIARAKLGAGKYGHTTATNPLTPAEWALHAQQEAMDFAVYLERLRKDLLAIEASCPGEEK